MAFRDTVYDLDVPLHEPVLSPQRLQHLFSNMAARLCGIANRLAANNIERPKVETGRYSDYRCFVSSVADEFTCADEVTQLEEEKQCGTLPSRSEHEHAERIGSARRYQRAEEVRSVGLRLEDEANVLGWGTSEGQRVKDQRGSVDECGWIDVT
ncbi:hypothetical protein C8Q73DRAFT_784469 [Cubamyces lactineus]|nr:hypothetical protein C8Q73DRAFT_784469 [Cubamyces lactineus]